MSNKDWKKKIIYERRQNDVRKSKIPSIILLLKNQSIFDNSSFKWINNSFVSFLVDLNLMRNEEANPELIQFVWQANPAL